MFLAARPLLCIAAAATGFDARALEAVMGALQVLLKPWFDGQERLDYENVIALAR